MYGSWDFEAPEFQEPEKRALVDADNLKKDEEYDEKIKVLEEELEKLRERAGNENEEQKKERKTKSKGFIRKQQLSEAETRTIIDEKLRSAGLEADTENINYQIHGTLPEKNKNMAIAEWKVKGGRVDYALFISKKLNLGA